MGDLEGPTGPSESAMVAALTAPAGPRRPLDQMRILHAAVGLIDADGLSELTMRRLSARLGVEAMALYRYVARREQVLHGVVEVVMDELYESTSMDGLSSSWQEYLQRQAHAVRTLAVTHPRIFPLVATQPPSAPWLRPPLRSLRWVESFLQGLREYRFPPAVLAQMGAVVLSAESIDTTIEPVSTLAAATIPTPPGPA